MQVLTNNDRYLTALEFFPLFVFSIFFFGKNNYCRCCCYSVVSCGDPGSLANGFRIGDKFTYGESVIYDCNPTYKLQGSIIRKCEANGQWSGSVASCVGESTKCSKAYFSHYLCTTFTQSMLDLLENNSTAK